MKRVSPCRLIRDHGGNGVNFGAATTRALAATAVPVLAALLAQRYMVRTLSLGAVTG